MADARRPAVRSILVAGGGIVALSAAIAFARALPDTSVTIVATPVDPAALADRMSGILPAIARFHAAIGLDEQMLVRAGAATHRLGTRFEQWSADGATWLHCFGDHGGRLGGAAFQHHWARARAAKDALAFHRYAPGAALAEAGRFVHPSDDPASLLSAFDYALRLEPGRYRDLLARAAERLAIPVTQARIGGVARRTDGGLAALLTEDGRRIEADLFLDCTGPAASLLTAVDDAFEDWSAALPCDRVLIGAGGGRPPSPIDIATATSIGWRWAAPGVDAAAAGLAYAAEVASEARARRVLKAETGLDDAEQIALRPGRRRTPWVHNVVAFGDAAQALDPLESTNLHLAQSAIMRALALLPGRDCHPLELAEYNRQTAAETTRVRDFVALHYLGARRTKGAFWEAMARRAMPDTLAHTVEQFATRGRLPHFEEESFTKESWLAALIGLGFAPRQIDPRLAAIPAEQSLAAMRRLADRVAALPATLPPYADYLARMRA